jgi:type VI secretion system protein ImpJ
MNRSTESADLPYGIQWSEGLLLSPQHLQQSDRFWHAQLRYLIGCANPDFSGVRSLALDDGLLEQGRVVVRSVECVLDDGTPIVFDKTPDAALELDAKALLPAPGMRARISLVLPLRSDTAATAGSMNRRYESVAGGTAVDENTGRNEVAIARLRPAIRLDGNWTPGANRLAGCELLELECTSSGTYCCTAYHPPMASLAASAFLQKQALRGRFDALRDLVRMRLREIAQAGEGGMTAAGMGDPLLALAARSLAAILPGLDVLGCGADVAPRVLYAELARAAGTIAALDPLPDPPVLPPYLHRDCYPGFNAALTFIETRVKAIRPSFQRLPFERDETGAFVRELPSDASEMLLIEVTPAAAQTREDLERWFESCSIAHPRLLEQLDSRRIPGARAQPALANRKGMNPAALYYEIHNAAFDFGDGLSNVFAPGEPLTIRGSGPNAAVHAPAGIVLYFEPGGARHEQPGHARQDHARPRSERPGGEPHAPRGARDPAGAPAEAGSEWDVFDLPGPIGSLGPLGQGQDDPPPTTRGNRTGNDEGGEHARR